MEYKKKDLDFFLGWLTLGLFLIFVMIIVGGLTRLTDSGLSITEWELFKGLLPPLNEKDWVRYFNLYKNIPQYEIVNSSMSLSEFKIIFYWEWFHRVLGRLIGLFFLIPLLYFQFKKNIPNYFIKIGYLILFLVILQGIVGWYMVKSGLVNDITVSHYRLSLHLTIAIIILSIIFWQILNLRNNKQKKFFYFSKTLFPYIFLIFLIYLQIILGAFVSGLDAGKIYQTWPLMGDDYTPNDLIINKFKDLLNFENHSLVQFYHRNLAYLISLYIFVLGYLIVKSKIYQNYKSILILISVLFFQILLGILTLISNLNMALASAHQISSVLLVLSALNLYYTAIK